MELGHRRSVRVPEAPMKKNPYVSRLNAEETAIMDEHDAYGSALPVDLEQMPKMPVGDDSPPGYNNVSKLPGALGGKKTKSKRKSKRKPKRKTASKSSKVARKPKRKTVRKSRKNKRK
jgi:hypothetical protein